MAAQSLRPSTRLGLTHGALVALLVILLGVTLQGVVRMLSLVVQICDQHLSSVDAEEEVHRAAWKIEVAMRHGRETCMKGGSSTDVRTAIKGPRTALADVLVRRGKEAPEGLRSAAQR